MSWKTVNFVLKLSNKYLTVYYFLFQLFFTIKLINSRLILLKEVNYQQELEKKKQQEMDKKEDKSKRSIETNQNIIKAQKLPSDKYNTNAFDTK